MGADDLGSVLPHSTPLELGVVAAALVHPGLAGELGVDTPNLFFDPDLARALSHIQAHAQDNRPVDVNLLWAQVEGAGENVTDMIGHLTSAIYSGTPTPSMAKQYVGQLRELAAKREAMLLGFDLNTKGRSLSAAELVEIVEHGRERVRRIINPADKLSHKTVHEILAANPALRAPIVDGLLREGETMNVIAAPKIGKSWAMLDLIFAMATGGSWLGRFSCERGAVLLIDNELHMETIAGRIRRLLVARQMDPKDLGDNFHVDSLRGRLVDLYEMQTYFARIEPGRYRLIILDAFYRFLPRGTDENSNSDAAALYNALDRYADRLGCAFVLVHHSTKGSQSGKAITDVGAGAGSQSRAADSHVILRHHEEQGAVVLDAVTRSWAPVEPFCLRWEFPVWMAADELDPAALQRHERSRREGKKPKGEGAGLGLSAIGWDTDRYVREFLSPEPILRATLLETAKANGMSMRLAEKLLNDSVDMGKAYRWTNGRNRPQLIATVPQPELEGIEQGAVNEQNGEHSEDSEAND